MDEKLAVLFKEWLEAFEAIQAAKSEKAVTAAHKKLAAVEARIAATPAEGLPGVGVKLGLHQFLNDHADAASVQVELGLFRPRAVDRTRSGDRDLLEVRARGGLRAQSLKPADWRNREWRENSSLVGNWLRARPVEVGKVQHDRIRA